MLFNKLIISILAGAAIILFSFGVNAQGVNAAPPVVTGHTQVEHIENNSEHNWFNKNYGNYTVDSNVVNSIKKADQAYNIVVVGGTWCPDTHKELPVFYKVIDAAGFPREKVKLFFVDRQFKSPEMTSKKYKIKNVPTFIVFKGDKEKGRIVVDPKKTMEKDLSDLLK